MTGKDHLSVCHNTVYIEKISTVLVQLLPSTFKLCHFNISYVKNVLCLPMSLSCGSFTS